MKALDPIISDRLYLRRLEIDDAPDFSRYRCLPEVYEYQSFQPKNVNDIQAFFNLISEYPNLPNTWFQVAVCLKFENLLIGDIGIHFLEDPKIVEIGYTIDPHYQRRGFALESVSAVISFLFHQLSIETIIASVDPRNEPSIKLLTRIGFTLEKVTPRAFVIGNEWVDDMRFTLEKNNYYENE